MALQASLRDHKRDNPHILDARKIPFTPTKRMGLPHFTQTEHPFTPGETTLLSGPPKPLTRKTAWTVPTVAAHSLKPSNPRRAGEKALPNVFYPARLARARSSSHPRPPQGNYSTGRGLKNPSTSAPPITCQTVENCWFPSAALWKRGSKTGPSGNALRAHSGVPHILDAALTRAKTLCVSHYAGTHPFLSDERKRKAFTPPSEI